MMFTWTPENIETLRRLAGEGKSFSQAAAALGCSRNSVCGKASRLGIQFGQAPKRTATRAAKRQPRPAAPSSEKRPPTAKPTLAQVTAIETPPAEPKRHAWDNGRRVEPWIPVEPTERPAGRLSVLDLTERTCKWMIGQPGEPDAGFCGAPKDPTGPYCPDHAARAYVPATPRKTRKAA